MNLSPKSARRSTALPIGNTRKMEKSSKSDYGIFIAPLFGNIRAGELIVSGTFATFRSFLFYIL